MKNYKELMKNIGVLTISNFGSKLLSFFLVPLYTYVLTTQEYGEFDFITTTVSLLLPILTLNISESALRFLLDKKYSQQQVCNISAKILLISIILIIVLAFVNKIFNIISILNNYLVYFLMYYIVFSIYTYFQNITRGLNKLNKIAISGIINSLFMLILNILFLLVFKLGLDGYFLANIIANAISILYLFISIRYDKLINLKEKNDKELKKDMIDYGTPLMMNSIGWWVNSISDRYVVLYMCGAAANGIYSVASKIPSILSIFQGIFNQAWGISAVKEFKKDDDDNFFTNTYSVYNILMVFSCSLLIIFSKILAKFLYMKEFYDAWIYMPFLMLAIVFGALSGLFGGVFSAVKDSKILGRTTMLGAILNIILNIILVYKIGVIGAAIATLISYFVVWLVRLIYTKKYINLKINIKKDLIVYLLLLVQSIVLILVKNNYLLYSLEFMLLFLEFMLYKNQLKNALTRLKKRS